MGTIDNTVNGVSSFIKVQTVIFALIGLIFVGLGTVTIVQTQAALAHDQITTGHIVGFSQITSARNGTSYAPVVAFTTPDGVAHQFNQNVYSQFNGSVGQTVQVAYDPSNPSHAYIKTAFYEYGTGAFMILFGVLFIFGGFSSARRKVRAINTFSFTTKDPAAIQAFLQQHATQIKMTPPTPEQMETLKKAYPEMAQAIEQYQKQNPSTK